MADEATEPNSETPEADLAEDDTSGEATDVPSSSSEFEIFESPPVVDPNRFGPVPVVGAEDPPPDEVAATEPGGPADSGVAVPAAGDSDAADALWPEEVFGEDKPPSGDAAALATGWDDPNAASPTEEGADDVELPPGEEPAEQDETALPHWTEPGTGQVPRVVTGSDVDEVWAEVTGPRWKGEGPDWADDDLAEVFGDEVARADDQDIDDVAEHGTATEAAAVIGAEPPAGSTAPAAEAPSGAGSDVEWPEVESEGAAVGAAAGAAVVGAVAADEVSGVPGSAGSRAVRPRPRPQLPPSGERNLIQAALIGVVFAALALLAFRLDGNLYALGLIAIVTLLASLELFHALRSQGTQPATLLGVVASAGLPLGVYWRGESAFVLILGLAVVFGALWYLVGADLHRPALNLGLTLLGVSWVGGLAAFASLLLLVRDGKSIIVATIVITVASDTGGLAGGRAFGRTPFHRYSPNKTWEGTLSGFVAAVIAGLVLGIFEISAFSNELLHAVLLGVVVGVLAPLGDLTESMVKRDIGVKDMGHLLPGHGGVMDRIDGLLFALPGAYYLTLLLDLDTANIVSTLAP